MLTALAAARGVTEDAIALAAALAQPWASVVLSGAVTRAQLDENLATLTVGQVPGSASPKPLTPTGRSGPPGPGTERSAPGNCLHQAWSDPQAATWTDHRDRLAWHGRLWAQDDLTYFRTSKVDGTQTASE